MLPVGALQAEDDLNEDRDYLPTEILVTGERDDYVITDGSTGTKTNTALIDVPQTVQIITDDQLEDQSIRQLGEALRYVPGISLETGEGHRDEVFIRGQETTADFYLDGLRDDAQYYRALYNVERIEVLKGANALIFGRGGGGGVINRVSKTADLGGDITEADASIDSFGAFALTGDVSRMVGDTAALRINGTYEEFDNHRDFYEGRFIGIAPTAAVELGADTRLTAHYSYDDDRRLVDRGVPSFDGGPLRGFDETLFGDPDFNTTRAKVHIARSRIDHRFTDGLTANTSFQYAYYDKAYANVVPRGFIDNGNVEFSGYRDTQARENLIGQANLVWDVATGSIEHTILGGVEFSRQDTQNTRANLIFDDDIGRPDRFDAPLTETFTFPALSLSNLVRSRDSELNVFSAYIQDQISIGDHIELIGGVRFDRFDLDTLDLIDDVEGDRVDEELSPRFGLVVKPTETLSFYGSYTESFLPQAGDQFLVLAPTASAFAPEKFTNYELGVKWAPRANLFVTGAIFQLDRTNTRASAPDNPELVVLTGASETQGIELSLVGQILPGWQANIGYTYLDGEITSNSDFADAGTRLQQLPEHQFTAWNHVELTDQFGFGVGIIHQAEQFASFSNTVVLPDYWRVDAAAYYEVSDRLSFQLNVENLFDEDYYPSAHGNNNIQPAAPIHARVGVRMGF
ncbi:MAG: TonB-dependent siderophore receptor [Pontixanthobacter sp.]